MYCKYCGNQIDDNSKFCNSCGKLLVEQVENGSVKSNKCSAKKKKFSFIGTIAGLLSSLILFVVLTVFSTTTDHNYAFKEWLYFDIGFTYLCVESISHLITFISIILCAIFNIIVLINSKLLNIATTCIYMFSIATFAVCIFDFSNACFLIPSFPLIGVLIFSLVFMFISSTNKNNG